MTLRQRIANLLFSDVIQHAVNAAISARVDDSAGWEPLSGTGPNDRPWAELAEDLDEALNAWRKNFMVRRIVTLVRSYAIGNGITVSSKHRDVERFARGFWTHPQNRIDRRLGPLCDELIRSGELFIALFTNPIDGISYIRAIPAATIREVQTDPQDYEKELRYGELQENQVDLKWWLSHDNPKANQPTNGQTNKLPPVVYHYTINRPVGATRGESDLTTVLKWALRYSNWLEDRVRLNRIRTRAALLDIQIADDSKVQEKNYQLRRDDPIKAGIYVHGQGEEAKLHNLEIRADDVESDGRALRYAIAAGANTALHYFGEGEATNYATAKEMGEPTSRYYTERQRDLILVLLDVVSIAYNRYLLVTGKPTPAGGDLKLSASVTEVARADNQALAEAARNIVAALVDLKSQALIDDVTALTLALKFAGETFDEDQIAHMLANAKPPATGGQQNTNEIDEE